MRVIGILGSARRGGNTETMMKEAFRGAGSTVEGALFVLEEMNIHGCQGCRGCRVEGSDGCIFEDDMQEMYAEMGAADALIMGSPIYYGEVTGQMKSFMDRWYALRDKDRKLRIAPGKRVLFIAVQGAEGTGRYQHTLDRIKKTLTSYEMKPEVLVAHGVEKKGAVNDRPELLEAAFRAGVALLSAG